MGGGAAIWGCSDINNQMWSSCWPRVREAGQVSPFVSVQALWRLLRLTGMGTIAGEIRLTKPWRGAWHSQEQRVAGVCHFYPFPFFSSFFSFFFFFFLFFSLPPSTPPFLMGFGPSLTKDDSQFSDKASRGRTWIAIIWYSWWNSWLKVISFVLTLQTQTESKHMTLSGKHYWTINVCLNVTRSPEVSPVTQLRFFFSMLTFILSVILSSYTQAACLKNEESSQRLLGRSTINGSEREFAEKIGIKINIDVCRLIRATAQNGCPSEDRAAVMGGSFCSH